VAQCRTDMRFGLVPIIMVTSENDPGFILRALKTGATSYLVKPVSYGDLQKRIGQILRNDSPKSVGG
jgi:DNA-binding response OmpR family regulator